MEYRNEDQGVMADNLTEAWECAQDEMEELLDIISVQRLEEILAEFGLMIVPIEDPTNLRYGVTIDDLAD